MLIFHREAVLQKFLNLMAVNKNLGLYQQLLRALIINK